ncbi:MAG: hypothetical protein ACKOX3_04680 [Bacteroidota bacterium]
MNMIRLNYTAVVNYFIIAAASILIASSANAQTVPDSTKGGTKNLGNEDINVYKEYTPVLNDAFKINITPVGDTSIFNPPTLTYTIDPKPMNSNYNLSPIKPVKIKDDNIKKLYKGFIKAGYGLQNLPMVDLYFNSLRSKEFNAGVRYNHLSSTGGITDYGNPSNNHDALNATGIRYFDKLNLTTDIGFKRDLVHYYGYKAPDLFSKAETKHVLQDVNASLGIQTKKKTDESIGFNGGVAFYTFSDNLQSSENNFTIKAGAEKTGNKGNATLDVSYDAGKYNLDTLDFTRNIFRIMPRLNINKNLAAFTLGANLVGETENNIGAFRIYPFAVGTYHLIPETFTVYGKVSGDLQRNDLRSFANQNPFFGKYLFLQNTNNKIAFEAGAKIKLEHNLLLTASASYSDLSNMPFFYNTVDTVSVGKLHDAPTSFNVQYDNVKYIKANAAIEYKFEEKTAVGVSVEYNNYQTDKLAKPLYTPAIRAGLHGSYAIAEKIFAKADVFYIGESNGLSYDIDSSKATHQLITNNIKLKGYVDANLTVDYRYTKLLSVFISLNNVGFTRYFRYYNYPNYRFVGMAGLTYSF